jgi:hypothetical protein
LDFFRKSGNTGNQSVKIKNVDSEKTAHNFLPVDFYLAKDNLIFWHIIQLFVRGVIWQVSNNKTNLIKSFGRKIFTRCQNIEF